MPFLSGLKPGAVLGAAAADTKRYLRNVGLSGKCEQYAFHRKHVRKAMRRHVIGTEPPLDRFAIDILRIALEDRKPGLLSGKRWTILLYSEGELLEAALTLGEQRTTDESSQS